MQKSEKIPVLAGVLLVVTALVAFMLATVNQITEPIISQNAEKELIEARKAVLKEATDFYPVDVSNHERTPVFAVYAGKTGETNVGYCVNVKPVGYGGEIDILVGINASGTLERVVILSMAETAGLGAKAQDERFLQQYAGKKTDATLSVIKNGTPDEEEVVVAISGATVTSKAVTEGVQAALSVVRHLEGKWAE